MDRLGRMMVLASSSLAFLACQGCVGTSVDPELALYDATSAHEVLVSDGIRLATEGVQSVSAVATFSPPPNTAQLLTAIVSSPTGLNGPVAPVVAIPNEALTPHWAIETQSNSAGPVLSGLNWSSAKGVQKLRANRDASHIVQPVTYDKNFSAAFNLGATREETGLAFDVGLVPSVRYSEEGELRSQSFGAELRFGRDFDQRGTSAVADSWYVFAGTEGEALVWEAGEYGVSNFTGSMALRDQVTVGDLQAGVSLQRGPGQFSLSYIRREVEWGDRNGSFSMNEDFAGVSFTLKR